MFNSLCYSKVSKKKGGLGMNKIQDKIVHADFKKIARRFIAAAIVFVVAGAAAGGLILKPQIQDAYALHQNKDKIVKQVEQAQGSNEKPDKYKQDADHEESHRRPRHLRQEKERGARLVRPFAQPLLEIAVDGGEVIPVVDGEQEETYEEIAYDEAEAHLQIGHISLHHHAGHADEGDARDGGSHHSEGYHIPGRTPVGPIKCFVAAGSPCREVTEHQEHAEVSQNCDNDNHFFSYILNSATKVLHFMQITKFFAPLNKEIT